MEVHYVFVIKLTIINKLNSSVSNVISPTLDVVVVTWIKI